MIQLPTPVSAVSHVSAVRVTDCATQPGKCEKMDLKMSSAAYKYLCQGLILAYRQTVWIQIRSNIPYEIRKSTVIDLLEHLLY